MAIRTPESAAPNRADILSRAKNGTLLEALFNEWGRHWFDADDPFISELATLHNNGEVDLLALVTPETLEPFKGGVKFFAGQHIYRALISKLNASAEALMRVVDALLTVAGTDGAAGLPVDEFAKWCAGDPSRPDELLDLIDRKIPIADRYLTIAIKYGVAVDTVRFTNRAYQFLADGTDIEKRGAINALGQIPFVDAPDYDRFVAAFNGALLPDPGDATRAAILTAVVRRLKDAPVAFEVPLTDLAIAAVAPRGDQTLFEGARALAFSFDDLTPRLIEALLDALLDVNPEHKGTIDSIDYALQKLVEAGDSARARHFLERLFARDEDAFGFEQFDSLRHKLLEVGGEVLEDWVVAWLRTGDFDLCQQMDHHLFGAGTDEFAFRIDFTRFGLEDSEYCYLARKAIGSFFLKPFIMTSILTSLLRSAPVGSAHEIEELLVDPILINYSGAASKHLKLIADDGADTAARAAKRALDGLDLYIAGLKSIGEVPELHPSERERQLEWQRHSDSMAEAWRKARKKSILASIMSESLMLYGNRSVDWVLDPSDEPRRIETPLASFGHSFEMPRIDTVDPLGLQMMLISFRQEKAPA